MTTIEDNSYTKLPIEERCVHKLWKARKSGYEDAIKLFGQLDEKASEWNKFIGIIKKFVTDSNAISQEKGLEATLVFVKTSTYAGRTVVDVMTGLITKCYGAPKAKTKEMAIQITLMFIEIEEQNLVIEELVKGMDHKYPKIVSTCIKAAIQSIREFGSKVLNIKLLLKKLQSVLEDRDKSVRDEAKLLAIEMYSWIGPTPVKANLVNLKPLQIQELEVEFAKTGSDKPQPIRFLRSQQKKAIEMEEEMTADVKSEEDNDPEEHINPINILSHINKDFYEKLESKKWQERKEAIDMLEELLSKAMKLESGDYGDLVRALMKVITKDSNVILVGIAVKCMTMLAKGLKKHFETYSVACLPALLEKFKEKKQNVVLPLRDAVDAFYLNMSLESVHEHILTAISNKNPSVKAESVSFLNRCFTKCTTTILNKKMLKTFTTILVKTLNESDPIIRDYSAEALGTAWKVVSEKNILPFLTNVDAIKLAKIKEAAEKVIITSVKEFTIKAGKSSSKNEGKKAIATNNKNTFVKNSTISVSNKTSSNNKIIKHVNSSGYKVLPVKYCSKIESEKDIDDNELEELALTICSPEILNGIVDLNENTRLSHVQEFSEIIDNLESLPVSSQVLIKLLNKNQGIKDNNVLIQKLKLECLKKIIEKFPISSITAEYCVQNVISLLGDCKNESLVNQILTAIAESTTLEMISNLILEYAFYLQKSPKVQIDALNWFSNAILEFGFLFEPKSMMKYIKKTLGDSNPQVRTAVISLLSIMYLYIGCRINIFFENEKPALVQQIKAELEKQQGKVPPKPKRGKNIEQFSESSNIVCDDEKFTPDINVKDNIVLRVDITSQITDTLINALSDKDWKVRSNALIKLQNIVNEAKFITSELGETRKALQERISDSNPRLSSNAINLVESISIAMGPSFKIYIRDYLYGVINAFGDSKIFKRLSARQCLSTWADVCGYRELFSGDILLESITNTSSTIRLELWTWLAEKLLLIPLKTIPVDELKVFLPHLYFNLEDRNVSIRNASEKAIVGFMIHLGYKTMYNACEKLRPMSIKFCREKLEKERPNLPIVITEKSNIKSDNRVGASIKSGESKFPPQKTLIKAIKENTILHGNVISGEKKNETDNESLFQQNNLKHQRDIDEHKLKSLKWNFTSPRKEFIEQLREHMVTAGINNTLIKNMFHSNFKFHLVAIETLLKDLNTSNNNNLALISNLDLILKWMTLRFFDTNPSVLIKGLEYLQQTFDILIVQKYVLHDTETSSFIPYLITKIGDPKDTVRNHVRVILKQSAFIIPKTKIFQYVLDGVKSKNSRQRSECLEHLKNMIEDFGTSICQPNVAVACKEIAKSIGDRDNSVRTAALNFFVSVFFSHGEAIFQFVCNISEKDMDLLKERLKRASRNQVVPVATIQPTVKTVLSSVEQVSATDDSVTNDHGLNNNTFNISPEPNNELSSQRNSNNLPSESATSALHSVENNFTASEQPLITETESRRSNIKINDKPQMKRFALDEKFIQELEAEVIIKPILILKPYNWTTDDDDEISFKKMVLKPLQSPSNNVRLSKPCLNVRPYSTSNLIKCSKSSTPVDPIQQLINQITSENLEISKTALSSLDKMLLKPDMRSKFLESGKVFSLFYAILKQFDNLYEYNNIDITLKYKNIFILCLNLYKYTEFTSILNEYILHNLLSKLLNLLNISGLENSTNIKLFGRCVNSFIMNILERSAHTPVTCALLAMLYDTVNYPQSFSNKYKELVSKCIWKIVKDLQNWNNDLCYDQVLAYIYKFLKKFDSKYWKKQQSDIPMRTCKTILHTLIRLHSDRVLESLSNSEYPKDSEMVMYINSVLKHLNK